MSNNRNLFEDHKLTTRRDFLSRGLIASAAVAMMPSPISLLARSAYAASCGTIGTPIEEVPLPMVVFDMAGGAGLPGNFLVGKRGGPSDLLSSYNALGWNPRESGSLSDEFGIPMSKKYSKLYQGIIDTTTANARANFKMGSFCHVAQDDAPINKLNMGILVAKAMNPTKFFSTGLGMISSAAGGNSDACIADLTYKPTLLRDLQEVIAATRFGGAAYTAYKNEHLKVLATRSLSLASAQAEHLSKLEGASSLRDVVKCAYEKSIDLLSATPDVDPRINADAQAVFQIATTSSGTDAKVIAASLAYAPLKSMSGPTVFTLGGCDYHTGTATEGDKKDYEMGQQIGRSIELAYRLKRPLFFQLITDGGVAAPTDTRNWNSDAGVKCMSVIGYFNPKGTPKMIRQQVGSYTDGQGADTSSIVGSNPQLAGYAAFANYLNCLGRLSEFNKYVPGVFTKPEDLESILIFDGGIG